MKIFNRIISLIMVALMLTTALPFTPVSAAENVTYTLTEENTYADSYLAENSAVGAMNSEFDGCYGNQLSDVAKELYDSLVKQYAEDRITEAYTHTFETPYAFNAEISDGYIVMNDELNKIYETLDNAMQTALDAFLYDHPEVFWLKSTGVECNISVKGDSVGDYVGSISSVIISPVEIYSGASDKLSLFEKAVDSVLEKLTVTESRYDTLKNIHDYICNNAWYNLVGEQNVHTSEPFFIGDGGVVCEGYSKTFKILCNRLGIPCVLVSGYAGENHMWNYVQMEDGKWYLADVTWDDQENQTFYTYFLANTGTVGFNGVTISEERTVRTDFSGTGKFNFTYPVLSTTEYGAHIHEWDTEYTVDTEPSCTEKGSKSIHCKTCDETKSVTEISAYGHSWDEGVINIVSTCKTHGIKTYTCQNNGAHQYTEQLAFDAGNHEGGTYIRDKVEATCTSEGYTGDVCCSGCNVKLSAGESIPVKAHTFTAYSPDGNATCLTDGTKTAVCDVCKKATDTVADENSKNNAVHKYSVRSGYSATCTADGQRTYVCDICETAAYMEIIPATGHKGGTSTCKTPAKCTSCGISYGSLSAHKYDNACDAECNVCSAVRAASHKLTTLKAKAATYKETGLTEGKKCSVCGEITVAQQTVEKLKPAKVTGLKTKSVKLDSGSKTTLTLAWTKLADAKQYEVQQYVGKKWKTVKKTSKTTLTVKKLKANKSYKFRVRAIYDGAEGAYSKTLTAKTVPLKTTLTLKAGKEQLTANWASVVNITGYEVQYSTSKKMKSAKTVTVKKAKTKKTTVKKLSKGKKYYVKVRAYKTVSGKKIYGSWSSVKSVKVK